ncbi:glycosyltransferase [Nocardioides ochotonae]|uniref:glycosyltransferase n=1 Tax=Nocardioides ochotonae TaxID=2685869 RepID=UPI00140D0E28|nr:hypothetical protein [Nocardioides ochotonae]
MVLTLHNLRPHEGATRLESLFLRWFRKLTREAITLIDGVHAGLVAHYIPHGHYKDVYPATGPVSADSDVVAFVGAVRAYKGVDRLVQVFVNHPSNEFRLIVAGGVSDPRLGDEVRALGGHDERVELRLTSLTSNELSDIIDQCFLIVLPFREVLNSGTALLALSLGRPVLMPLGPGSAALQVEFGARWVRTYEGDLTGDVLIGQATQARDDIRRGLGELNWESREWDEIARRHAEVYYLAAGMVRER